MMLFTRLLEAGEKYHEYRFSYGLAMVAGLTLGLIDGLARDWTVKFFLALPFLVVYSVWALAEVYYAERPLRNTKKALLMLIFAWTVGLVGFWDWVWVYTWILQYGYNPFTWDRLWLAPNIYMPRIMYHSLTLSIIVVYFTWGLAINFGRVMLESIKERHASTGSHDASS
ncbi:MAG: hypothetical protein QXW39_08135 [Candidatus Bathyarchaeia archaeon]|uniref:hypothetical protein n=1 Tax=Thermofilum sp. TaxID=1961369 RepID=UPI003164D25F